ncbi:MAG: non-homologous end-joining DNA ligase [bacterium]
MTSSAPKPEEISASRADKVMFREAGLTKSDLVDYYRRIAPVMLRYLKDRAITLRRFPDGIGEEGFFQKNTPDYFPDWIPRLRQKKEDGYVEYTGIDSAAALAWIADQGTIELHAALSRADRPETPDQIIFDLDPSTNDFSHVQEVASALRELCDAHGVPGFVKTTGSRGLHVLVPLDATGGGTFDEARDWARQAAERIAREHDKLATVEQRKDKRGGRVFVDYLRNAYGQTAIAPWSLRARPEAPVATPLDWEEALAAGMKPDKYTLKNIFKRLAQKDDPWADLWKDAPALGALPRF